VVAPNGSDFAGLAALWEPGVDGIWGTSDDVTSGTAPNPGYRSYSDLDAGLFVYALQYTPPGGR
jgi:hypothetical protein